MTAQKRNVSADILRCLAFFFVVSVHFFLKNGFYSQPVEGGRMYIMTMMRQLFIICVPLFITLSGYLLRKKELSTKYYKRVSKILITYLLASVACMIYSGIFMDKKMTLSGVIFKLLNFSGAPYAWYIEMYLGLFLLIPFLNILYNNIPTKRWKLCLVLSVIALTSLPSVINVYSFSSWDWWTLPSASSASYSKLIPAWWTGIYPVTYYFIGCYLSEFGLKLNSKLNFALIVLCNLLSGSYAFWRSYKAKFIWGAWCGYSSLFNVMLTVLVFVFLINLNYDRFPDRLAKFTGRISGLCLGGYLLSYIFDSIFYPKLKEYVPVMLDRLPYYFLIVPLVYILSLAASYVLSKIQLLIEIISAKIISAIKTKRQKKRAELQPMAQN